LRTDRVAPWAGPAAIARAFEDAVRGATTAGAALLDLATELYPICRSITGPGLRETLDILGRSMTLERQAVPSGTACFDWIVPPEWTVRDAYVKDTRGERVIDFRRHNLHLMSYSRPVRAKMTLDELRPHLHSLPDRPDAIPYLTTYYTDDWGFCLADRDLAALTAGTYEVCIDTTLADGTLDYATASVGSGEAGDVLLTSYVCHPSMANNELSGPVLLTALYGALRAIPRLRHRYRFLLAPETIGAIAYLSREGERLRETVRAGYVVTCAGDDGPFTYKRSRRGDTLADRAALHALRHTVPEELLRIERFAPIGSDERQFCSPGFDLPVGCFARSIYGSYPEYHTSLDDLSVLSAESLAASLGALLRIVETIELGATYVRTEPRGEPQLSRHGLYGRRATAQEVEPTIREILYLLNYSDGRRDAIAIADELGEPLWAIVPALQRLLDTGLVIAADASASRAIAR
jgi:aminopeptidase-like protein